MVRSIKAGLHAPSVAVAAVLGTLATLISGCNSEKVVSLFEDVTASSRLPPHVGMTYGAAWGDVDSDGLPDLYVTNHLNRAKLFRNLGDGRFADVTDQWFSPSGLEGDKHGAAWADFDNDGRVDLVQLTGAERGVGEERKRLFANRGSRLEDIAETAGTSNPPGRTRMPLWVDLDGDGRLDLFQGAEARFDDASPPFLFMQREGRFEASTDAASFGSRSAPFCVLTQLSEAGNPDLVCRVPQKGRTAQVFSTGKIPLKEANLLPATAFEDIAAGDFDNDGLIDLYLARKNPAAPVSLAQPSPHELIADTWIDQASIGKPLGFSLKTTGTLDVRVVPAFPRDLLSPESVHIGGKGQHPTTLGFRLVPGSAAGKLAARPGAQAAVHIAQPSSGEWQVLVSGAKDALGKSKYQQVAIKITSTERITELKTVSPEDTAEAAPARLFMNRRGKLVEEGEKRGVNARLVPGVNVVAGDFDNDMHLDLFVVASGDVGKHENLLLLNRGDGRFSVVTAAGGAAGSNAGVGDSVTTVDFDRDGFLDLLVTTGGSMGRSMGLPSEAGGYRLYRNVGNGNRWLEIDLEGTRSNRDGIGARVELTAGGVTQVRIQDGGVHHRSQNHARVHFGLAQHAQADRIRVRWPSGTLQELHNVAANRVIRIKEPQ